METDMSINRSNKRERNDIINGFSFLEINIDIELKKMMW